MASRAWQLCAAASEYAEPMTQDEVAGVWRFLRWSSMSAELRDFLWQHMTHAEQQAIAAHMRKLAGQSLEARLYNAVVKQDNGQ